jgi:hypothetical protein
MPRKIRELIRDLRDAGFVQLPADRGKGDHTLYEVPGRPDTRVNLDGQPGDDARFYQEKQVREAIKKARGER